MKKELCVWFMIIGVILAVFTGSADAASNTLILEWQQSAADTAKADFDGWKLYWGTASGVYTQSLVVPFTVPGATYTASQTVTVPDNAETTIYFAIKAKDKSGNESGFSNEVSQRFDFLPPGNPFNLIIKVVTVP